MTSKVTYLGGLRTQCEHTKSGDTFITDAPTDNAGKGEAFSPTDTVATALASCILTVMAIKGKDRGVTLKRSTAEVTKVMASNPRRISEIKINMCLPSDIDQETRDELIKAANNCPVHHSLHPDIKKTIEYNWIDG